MAGGSGVSGDAGLLVAGNVLSAILPVNAAALSNPLEVNQAPSAFNSGPGDDLSWITLDGNFAYVGWGDTRSGFTNPYFAKVPLSLYE